MLHGVETRAFLVMVFTLTGFALSTTGFMNRVSAASHLQPSVVQLLLTLGLQVSNGSDTFTEIFTSAGKNNGFIS